MTEQISDRLSPRQLAELRKLKLVKQILDELRHKGISQDIPICPVCKSYRVVQLSSYYDLGSLGSFQPAYYCVDCGWYGRTLIIMSNRPENDAILEDLAKTFPEDLATGEFEWDDSEFID